VLSQGTGFKEYSNIKSVATLNSLSDVQFAAKRVGPNKYFCVPSFDVSYYKITKMNELSYLNLKPTSEELLARLLQGLQ
jgi:hypothetical protein